MIRACADWSGGADGRTGVHRTDACRSRMSSYRGASRGVASRRSTAGVPLSEC